MYQAPARPALPALPPPPGPQGVNISLPSNTLRAVPRRGGASGARGEKWRLRVAENVAHPEAAGRGGMGSLGQDENRVTG